MTAIFSNMAAKNLTGRAAARLLAETTEKKQQIALSYKHNPLLLKPLKMSSNRGTEAFEKTRKYYKVYVSC